MSTLREHRLYRRAQMISTMTFDQAIELGEYDPEFLSQFPEFKQLPRYAQFQFIRKALKNREKQLRRHYAELVNQLDFRNKPDLRKGLKNIDAQIKLVSADEERLLVEYSS